MVHARIGKKKLSSTTTGDSGDGFHIFCDAWHLNFLGLAPVQSDPIDNWNKGDEVPTKYGMVNLPMNRARNSVIRSRSEPRRVGMEDKEKIANEEKQFCQRNGRTSFGMLESPAPQRHSLADSAREAPNAPVKPEAGEFDLEEVSEVASSWRDWKKGAVVPSKHGMVHFDRKDNISASRSVSEPRSFAPKFKVPIRLADFVDAEANGPVLRRLFDREARPAFIFQQVFYLVPACSQP
jgi:hypothetical protein